MTDDTPEPSAPEWVTKSDVARRHICAAVRMFFEQADPVVTHSVISAGHQIATDLCSGVGKTSMLRGKHNSREHLRNVNFAPNFFKHADRDPSAKVNITPLREMNAEFLMDAVFMLIELHGNDAPTPAKIFCSWFVSKHPELFKNVRSVPRFAEFGIDPDNFAQIAALLKFSEIHDYAVSMGLTENQSGDDSATD